MDCPNDKTPMNQIPAGISKKTNRPYPAFWSCPTCKHTENVTPDEKFVQNEYPHETEKREAKEQTRQDSIIRQHSQHMAMLWFQARGIENFMDEELTERINWFDKDVEDHTK